MMTDVYMYSEIYILLTNPFKLKNLFYFYKFFLQKNKNSDSFNFEQKYRKMDVEDVQGGYIDFLPDNLI